MAEALEELKREAKAVSSAPIFVGALTMVLIVLIWFVVHWSYRSVLSNKNSYIASLERRVADYRETLNGASPEQARRRIEAMELELKTLHIRLAPRRLTAAQRESIADRSRLPPGAQSRSLTVMVQENCSDCPAFAAEIAAALRLSDNWTVSSQRLTHVEVHPRSGLGNPSGRSNSAATRGGGTSAGAALGWTSFQYAARRRRLGPRTVGD